MSGHIRSVETDECLSFGSQVILCLLLAVYCLGLEVVIGIDSRDRTRFQPRVRKLIIYRCWKSVKIDKMLLYTRSLVLPHLTQGSSEDFF